jgi:hypothetical protein
MDASDVMCAIVLEYPLVKMSNRIGKASYSSYSDVQNCIGSAMDMG